MGQGIQNFYLVEQELKRVLQGAAKQHLHDRLNQDCER
jgi:hypothetical protein